MKPITGLLLVAALLVPAVAEAQRAGARYNPFSFTPYAGVYSDAYRTSPDESRLGWIAGFRAGYHETDRIALHANVGYAQSPENQWVVLAVGGDYALVPGPTSIAAGAEGGVAWRNTRDTVAAGDAQDWGSFPVLSPTLTLRQYVGERATLALAGQLMILDVFSAAQLSPALTIGLSIR
jgi:hypothetical protein